MFFVVDGLSILGVYVVVRTTWGVNVALAKLDIVNLLPEDVK